MDVMTKETREQTKQALIEEITKAFAGGSREGGVSLSEAWVIDDYGSDEERAEARARDTDKRWEEVPDKDIHFGYSYFSFLDDIGFAYYIPAYMTWYLRNVDSEDPEVVNSNTFEFLIYSLGPSMNGVMSDYTISQFILCTREQRRAIAHFLQFVEAEEDGMAIDSGFPNGELDNYARLTLKTYWGQFL
jgi:hypothetical protein